MSVKGDTVSFPAAPEQGPPPLASGALIDGTYLVERLLGEGGSGAVYLVRHQGLAGARFALKVLRPGHAGASEALAHEGRLAAGVLSAHVVKVTGLGRLPGGAPYLVMEYVDGPTLDALLEDRDLVTAEAVECGRQVCLALEVAHERGLVHGDVSLRNLFATRRTDGRHHFSLGDFGQARRVAAKGAPGGTASFESGTFRGTPRFVAPEAVAGDDSRDQRSDLFSTGVVLYRLLAGVYPFEGSTVREVLTAILRGQPAPLGALRPGLGPVAEVVMRCLAADPQARYQSAREAREALEAAARPVRGEAPHKRRTHPSPPGRRLLWPALLGLTALGLGLGAPLGLGRWRATAPIPLGAVLDCPDVAGAAATDPGLARGVAQALCARAGAQLDLDWGGGEGATTLWSSLERAPAGGYLLRVRAEGREVQAAGESPLAAAAEAARLVSLRAEQPPLSAVEVHRWGASDEASARAARAVWRRRTAMVIKDYAQEPRAVLARDPGSPFAHLLLLQVERDPALAKQARAQLLANVARLPPDREQALRGYVAVHDHPEAPHEGLQLLQRAYNTSPDDVDIGLVYAAALQEATQVETLLAVAEALHDRAPRRALIAVHWAGTFSDHVDTSRLVARMPALLPELRCATAPVELLISRGRLAEADEACADAARLGLPETDRYIPEALLAMASGDPARIDRATVRSLGFTNTWPRTVAARLRQLGLALTGRVKAAGSLTRAELENARASGAEGRAVRLAAELLFLGRRADVADLGEADRDWLAQVLPRASISLTTRAFASAELLLARARAGATLAETRSDLDALDDDLERRANSDGVQLLRARLQTLPLVRLAHGDDEAVALWRDSIRAPQGDRLQQAFEAGLALAARGASVEAEEAFTAATRPDELVDHSFDSMAARLVLAGRYRATGREAQARALLEQVDRAWSGADPGLREQVLALR